MISAKHSINATRPAFILWIYFLSAVAVLFVTKEAGTAEKLAIEGYDPVAYFTLNKATTGKQEFTHRWKGKAWRFASQAHRDLFIANPDKYTPQFNGFCANGLSDGHVIEADPKNWRIIDGKLYLFFSEYGRKQWSGNVKPLIQQAKETLNEH